MKNRITELRSLYKLTQDDLAKKLNVSRQTIISLEKEKYNPSILLAYQISQIFSLSIEEVFQFDPKGEEV
ncbi:MAG: helix-turn-helix transcriptional regulator [Caldisericia bacterium]|nr:helix-turn-helix transcriptional regulator [Caldisericia bacterium]